MNFTNVQIDFLKCSKKISLLIIAIILSINCKAQNENFEPNHTPLLSEDNGISREIAELDMLRQKYAMEFDSFERKSNVSKSITKITGALPDTSCVVTIPIVFHVFHPAGSLGVPKSQIDYAINDLNITFAGKDLDYGTVNTNFSAIKSYTKIRFALASIDPKGNPTTGIIYYQDKQSGLGNGTGWDSEIKTMAWDNYKYFNIYIMNDLYADNVTNNSGVCWYPFSAMSDTYTARMVYNYSYLGKGGSSFNNLEFNQTFTHEAGHYLNLLHTFDGNSCSGVGDYCADTPPTDMAAAGCNAVRCGGLINGENYMDYNSTCYKNFTIDQNTRMEIALTHPARATLWQYDNLVATGVISPTSTNTCVNAKPFFALSKKELSEDQKNDGSIEAPPIKIYACAGIKFAKLNTTLTAGIDYLLSGLPVGLTASLVTDVTGKIAIFTVSGNALLHAKINSVDNVQFEFTNAAILGGGISTIINYRDTFKVNFYDPWSNICDNPVGVIVSPSSSWKRFETIGSIPRYYGLWYNSGSFYLENYGRGIITTSPTSDNIAFLPIGTTISSLSTWRVGGSQGVLYAPTYTALDGQVGYVGFRMQAQNDFYYGWMKIRVTSTGVTLLEYQYNLKPNAPITAGSSCFPTSAISESNAISSMIIYPNPSSGKFYIECSNRSLINETYEIFNLDGKKIESGKIENIQGEVDLGNFPNGIYLVQIKSKDGTTLLVDRISIVRQ